MRIGDGFAVVIAQHVLGEDLQRDRQRREVKAGVSEAGVLVALAADGQRCHRCSRVLSRAMPGDDDGTSIGFVLPNLTASCRTPLAKPPCAAPAARAMAEFRKAPSFPA